MRHRVITTTSDYLLNRVFLLNPGRVGFLLFWQITSSTCVFLFRALLVVSDITTDSLYHCGRC